MEFIPGLSLINVHVQTCKMPSRENSVANKKNTEVGVGYIKITYGT